MFQPAAILEMEVYHNEQKGMQRIKECSWSFLYQYILSDVVKNSIALYLVGTAPKNAEATEGQSDLFYFCEDALMQLDQADMAVAANFALYFSLNLPQFFGFRIHNNYSEINQYLDLSEGKFHA